MVYQTIIKDHTLLIVSILVAEPKQFLDSLRKQYNAVIQIIDMDAVVDREHIEEIIKQVLEAYDKHIMVSKHIETEILLRIACTNQIYKAIEFAGAKDNKVALFIALSKDTSIINKLIRNLDLNDIYYSQNYDKLLEYHNITDDQLDAILDDSIRSLLLEKANLIY